jgi:hypothetical protein
MNIELKPPQKPIYKFYLFEGKLKVTEGDTFQRTIDADGSNGSKKRSLTTMQQ